MKQVDEMPTEGQFVAVWENAHGVWSGTFKCECGVFYRYDIDKFSACWNDEVISEQGFTDNDTAKFFIAD